MSAEATTANEHPSSASATVLAPDSTSRSQIGPYRLLEKIGEGGFGEVWLAEQKEPVRRRIAIKIIKLGMDTRQVVARFEAERQALAMMDHPNIARVLDAGATELGRPFFVMELVKGIPITDYCNTNGVGTAQRLDLFIQVCRAIQHAHQKGIIHRDIKPSNILVTMQDGTAVPKVIDFGIAKATQVELTEKTVYTQLNQFIGTPAYISPEQAEMTGIDIDTRSDIYSLGVLLYELLTGSTPFDTKELLSAGLDEMRRIIREREPVRPSTRLKSLAPGAKPTQASSTNESGTPKGTSRPPSTTLSVLQMSLSTDLDWIILKCLEKDRTRRYETATGLAFDIERYLQHEPVSARPPSTAYRLRKLVLRHKTVFVSGAIALVSLIVALILASWSGIRARRAEQREKQLRISAEHNEFISRQRAYASDINLAQHALDERNFGQAIELLKRNIPTPGQKDLRGWEWRYLWQQCQSDELFTLARHDHYVSTVSFSPDGKLLAAATQSGKLDVWNVAQRQLVRSIPHNTTRGAGVFSADGKLFAMTTERGASLWNPASWQETKLFALSEPVPVNALEFSPDSALLAVAYQTGDFDIWDVRSQPVLRLRWQANHPLVFKLSWSSDMRLLSSSGVLSGTRVWRVSDAALVREFVAEPQGTSRFSSNSPLLVTAHRGSVTIWDTQSWSQLAVIAGHASGSAIFQVAFSPDGTLFATAGADQQIIIWDVSTRQPKTTLKGHLNEVFTVAFSPDGQSLASGSKDQTVRIWPLERKNFAPKKFSIPRDALVALSPNNQKFLVAREGTAELRDTHSFESLLSAQINPSLRLPVLSTSGKIIGGAFADGIIRLIDLSSGICLAQFHTGTNHIEFLRMSPDAQHVAAGFKDDTVLLWRASQPEPVWSHRLVRQMAFSPDNSFVVVCSATGETNLILNLSSLQSTQFTGHKSSVTGASVSWDNKLIVTESWDGTARIWSAQSGAPLWTFRSWIQSPGFSAFSPDNRRVAIRAGDTHSFWDIESGQELLKITDPSTQFFFFLDQDTFITLANWELTQHRVPPLAEVSDKL